MNNPPSITCDCSLRAQHIVIFYLMFEQTALLCFYRASIRAHCTENIKGSQITSIHMSKNQKPQKNYEKNTKTYEIFYALRHLTFHSTIFCGRKAARTHNQCSSWVILSVTNREMKRDAEIQFVVSSMLNSTLSIYSQIRFIGCGVRLECVCVCVAPYRRISLNGGLSA